jgi:zinc protease
MNWTKLLAVAAVLLLPTLPAQAFSIQRVTSDGGIEAWLVEDHTNPIIATNFAFRGGSATDPVEKIGLANMVASLLDEGAGDMDSQTFQGKLEDLAISLGYSANEDSLRGHLKTVTANSGQAFDLLKLSLTAPRFDADAVERIRGQIQSELSRELRDPGVIAERALAKTLYPDHPYGRPADGLPETINAITGDDLKSYLPHHFARDRLMVAVVGDITPAQLKPLLDSTFGALPATADPITVADTAPATSGKVDVIRMPIPQSVVMFAEQGVKRADPDWYGAYVLNYVLGGGGFSSRLMQEVRVKRGLAYGVSTFLAPYDHSALIEGEVATRNDRVAESIDLIRQQWRHLAEGGVTPKELADAKTFLTGSFPLQLSSTESIAGLLVQIRLDNLGIDYLDRRNGLINGVTAADAQRIAKRLFNADALTAVVVGDPKGL